MEKEYELSLEIYDKHAAVLKGWGEILTACSNDLGEFHKDNTVSVKRTIIEASLIVFIQELQEHQDNLFLELCKEQGVEYPIIKPSSIRKR